MKSKNLFYILCFTGLCLQLGCAQKKDLNDKFCSFNFKKIMSTQYTKDEYECFLIKSKNYLSNEGKEFLQLQDLMDFRLYNKYDHQLNSQLDVILIYGKMFKVNDLYQNLKYLELYINGAEDIGLDQVYSQKLQVIADSLYEISFNRPWRDYQMLRLPYETKRINFFEFFKSIKNSGVLDSSDSCLIANDLYYKLTKMYLKRDTITSEWLDTMQTVETKLSQVCPYKCLLSRTEWYAFLKDKRFYNFNCDTMGYFNSIYNMCSEMIYLTEQDSIPLNKIRASRIKMEKIWSMDQYLASDLGKYAYGFIIKAKAYEYFFTGKYKEFENLILNVEENEYLWKGSDNFKIRRNQEITILYEKVFNKDPFSLEAENFYYRNFPRLFSNQ